MRAKRMPWTFIEASLTPYLSDVLVKVLFCVAMKLAGVGARQGRPWLIRLKVGLR